MRRLINIRIVLQSSVVVCTAAGGSAPVALGATPSYSWPSWGGVNGDFKVAAGDLADQWPAEGPKKLWSRSLGEGYSAIVADSGRLYTMYRQGDDEIIVALRADTGQTLWEHRCQAKPYPGQTDSYGQGPNATPLIIGDRIVTIGFTGLMHCLNLETGEALWAHDLPREFSGAVQFYGYANSPIAYNDTIITLVGGDRYGVVALKPGDGSIVWKSKPFQVSYAAPILINVDGQDQVVFFTTDAVVGIDAKNGESLWSHQVVNFCRTNCTSAVWGQDNLLWAATKGVGGTRVLKLTQREGKTKVEQVWVNHKIHIYHWNAVRVGDHVYTSSGDSKTFLSTIDVKTGKFVERQRGFGSTNGIYADGKLILLDDSGKLALAKVSPAGIEILSSVQLSDSLCWTVPTLVGKTLYVRDRRNILALDLG